MLKLVFQAGPIVQLVMLLLVVLSVFCWAIIFLKVRQLRLAASQTQQFQEFFWEKKRFDQIAQSLRSFSSSPLAHQFRELYQELLRRQQQPAVASQETWAPLQQRLERILRRAETQEQRRLERFLTFLASTGSTAPFIGLFGTVWGIMNAFQGIGEMGSASLAVVAPGISEALVATALGLVAAIPAVMAYNHLLYKVQVLQSQMEEFSQDLLNIAENLTSNQKEVS